MNNIWLKKIAGLCGIFLLVFLFNLSSNRIYEAETLVLLLPKNELVASRIDSAMENFKQVLTSLAFNDRLAENNSILEENLELPNYKRRDAWNSKISVERVGDSEILKIRNFDESITSARELNVDTVENFLAISGNYYNINTDLGIRIVDGPIARQSNRVSMLNIVWVSLLWSILVYATLFYLLPWVFVKNSSNRRNARQGESRILANANLNKNEASFLSSEDDYFSAADFSKDIVKTEESEETNVAQEENNIVVKNPLYEVNPITLEKKVGSPDNLPIGDSDVPDIFRKKEVTENVVASNDDIFSNTETEDDESQEDLTNREATPEEVKARLNKLLSGKN